MEDEFHVLCECNMYVNCIKQFFLLNSLNEKRAIFNTLTTKEKFIYIMKNEWKLFINM